jgi:hypothetical protein
VVPDIAHTSVRYWSLAWRVDFGDILAALLTEEIFFLSVIHCGASAYGLVEAGFDRIDRIIVRHICGQGDLRERHGPVGARDGKLAVFELDVALEYQTKDSPSATVCAHNPLGAKGCGEAGTIGAPAAIMNAVVNALAPLGVTDLAMPATPGRV